MLSPLEDVFSDLKFRVRYLALSERSHLTYHCPPRLSSSLGSTCFGFTGLTSLQPTFISHSQRLLVNTVSLNPNTFLPEVIVLTWLMLLQSLCSHQPCVWQDPGCHLGQQVLPVHLKSRKTFLCSCIWHVSLLGRLDPHNVLGPILGHSDLYNPFHGDLRLW